ncbi:MULTISPECIES: hypothetical protein [unclassified Xanthobacter]|uniref:hypothetical protein n=1 Tax=unclassified Xanthobacter TaxID=2623496 RepID=UPI001F2ED6AD|nr:MULTISPECIES: hypothetical protein [unclassified Xanthobacter]
MLTIDSAIALVTDTFAPEEVLSAVWSGDGTEVLVMATEAGEGFVATVWEGEDIDGRPVLYCDAGDKGLDDFTDALARANGLKPRANQDTVGDMTWHTWAGKVETIDAYASGELEPAWSVERMAAAKRDADAFNDAPELV